MRAFGLTSLALEWPGGLAPVIGAVLAREPLADHPWPWGGDGRITAGHLAVLAERSRAGPLRVTLFDGITGAGWSWSQRDEAMARRLLAGSPAGARTLAVAGNAHTPAGATGPGLPLGACPARQRPGIREIQIRYGDGRFRDFGSCQFAGRAGAQATARLYEDHGRLVLDLPAATEAVVPQRPRSPPPPVRTSP